MWFIPRAFTYFVYTIDWSADHARMVVRKRHSGKCSGPSVQQVLSLKAPPAASDCSEPTAFFLHLFGGHRHNLLMRGCIPIGTAGGRLCSRLSPNRRRCCSGAPTKSAQITESRTQSCSEFRCLAVFEKSRAAPQDKTQNAAKRTRQGYAKPLKRKEQDILQSAK